MDVKQKSNISFKYFPLFTADRYDNIKKTSLWKNFLVKPRNCKTKRDYHIDFITEKSAARREHRQILAQD